MKRISVFVAVVLTLAAFGCAKKAKDGVVASVNGRQITLKMVDEKIEKLPQYYQAFAVQHKKEIVDEMVIEELLYDEAKRRKLLQDPDTKELINDAIKKILISRVIEDETRKTDPVSDDDVSAYYEQNKDKYAIPEMVRACHILTSTEEDAEAVKAELEKGSDFSVVANTYSKDLTKDRGGDLGYFKKGQMIPEFENAAFSLEVGQTSGIVKTRFGYHIIRLTDRKPASFRTFEEVKDDVMTSIIRDKQRQSFADFTKTLKDAARISLNEDMLKSLEKENAQEPDAENDLPDTGTAQ
ncbi:MAG: peptidyl-prolyl cis-trans isomerase [Candidatus Omnitrophica bacterium]|nr:peptidyl-prolyl cis-trans isomerase [Candidatus Omnitrophota bacterium]